MNEKNIAAAGSLKEAWLKGAWITLFLLFLFLVKTYGKATAGELVLAVPFFLIFYFVQFTLGKEPVIAVLQRWIGASIWKTMLFPTGMLLLYLIYELANGQDILKGNIGLLIYIIYLPVLIYAVKNSRGGKIDWVDFTVFVLLLIPTGFFSIKQNSELPIHGYGFDSISHVMIILTGAYAFAVVRGIREVGFVAEFKWKSLGIALFAWSCFYLLVFVFGWSVDFIAIEGYKEPLGILLTGILFTSISTFLHTALFEELFFRGILQNMLAKRIAQGSSWKIFWYIGFALLLVGALLVGYTLEGKMKWFPALVTALIFLAAWLIEKSGKQEMGVYTSLAITGVSFGLVHYHAKSIIYIGLACVAGWAYGYTYHKTKNVFYSALVHMLVNTGVMIFGLKMMR